MSADPLAAAVEAHRAALEARRALDDAARVRGVAVREALASGRTHKEVADALGVKRERVYVMAKQGEK